MSVGVSVCAIYNEERGVFEVASEKLSTLSKTLRLVSGLLVMMLKASTIGCRKDPRL